MKYLKTNEDTELKKLSERIINIIKIEPYSATFYSKILHDIIITFIELRLDKFSARFVITPKINFEDYDFDNFFRQLNEKHEISSLNDKKNLSLILIGLTSPPYPPPYFGKEIYTLEDVLKDFSSNSVQVSKTDLISYYYTKSYVKLPEEVFKKYRELFSIFLTLSNLIYSSNNPGIENMHLPKKVLEMIMNNKENGSIEIDKMIFRMEDVFIKLLHHTLNEQEGLIKSLYRFPNIEAEIQNIRRFLKTNDIWKLDLIEPNFDLKKNGVCMQNLHITKSQLIHELRIEESATIELNPFFLVFVNNRYINDNYPGILEWKLHKAFDKWSNHTLISEWEKYWIIKENEYLQETKNKYSNTIDVLRGKEEEEEELKKKSKPRYSPNFTPELIRKCIEIRENNNFSPKEIIEELSSYYIEEKECRKCSYETIRSWLRINKSWYPKFEKLSEFEIVSLIEEEDIKPWFNNLKKDQVKYEPIFNKL